MGRIVASGGSFGGLTAAFENNTSALIRGIRQQTRAAVQKGDVEAKYNSMEPHEVKMMADVGDGNLSAFRERMAQNLITVR